jgi:Cytochrome c554 and c-prime
MNKRTVVSTIGLSLAAVLSISFTSTAAERDPANYVGVKTCAICHKKDDVGNQFGIWEKSPHAKAFETLGTPAAKEIGKKAGVDDPQKSGKCLKCHSTAYNFTESVATEKIKPEDSVTCESCHGPGKKFMSKSTMEDRQKAIAAGLVYPATESCKLCHNSESPTFKGFDEKAMVAKIAHPDPKVKH